MFLRTTCFMINILWRVFPHFCETTGNIIEPSLVDNCFISPDDLSYTIPAFCRMADFKDHDRHEKHYCMAIVRRRTIFDNDIEVEIKGEEGFFAYLQLPQ